MLPSESTETSPLGGVYRAVPLYRRDKTAPLRLCVVVQDNAEAVGGPFILLRDLADASVYLGCIIDAGLTVREWIEIWVQNLENFSASFPAYRQSAMEAADSAFRRVLSQCEREAGALAGRAYVAIRRGDLNAAKAFFVASVASLPGGYDGLSGLGMVAYRQGDTNLARESFTHTCTTYHWPGVRPFSVSEPYLLEPHRACPISVL